MACELVVPRVEVAVRTGHSEDVLQMVLKSEVQLGLGRELRHHDIELTPFHQEELVLMVAVIALLVSAFTNDFSVAYIAHHSNITLPSAYKFAALWSGVLPQQPPAMLSRPPFANSSR